MANERPNADVSANEIRNAARELETVLGEARGVLARVEAVAARGAAGGAVARGTVAEGGARGATTINEETAAYDRLAAAERRALAADSERLAILRAQNATLAQQATAARTDRAAASVLGPGVGPRQTQAFGQTLGVAGQAEAAARTNMGRLAAAQVDYQSATGRSAALTSDFISGLARGDVTVRQFGANIGTTISKFAGWTIAAGLVYTALGAVKELSAGAKDAASGVQGLTRFLPNVNRQAATEGFRQTSSDLNVPIKDVADAQQAFARVFHNQGDSLTAARVAIAAYKLDNISAADSFRFFTGIVQEFNLPASRLPLLFDQISAAQRRMGARVSEVLPALARSSAAVKNAGGDLNQLIAIATTAQVSSGQTGNTVGTALARGASNFVRRPDNQAILKSFGLDPNEGFTKLIIDAAHKTKELSGADQTKLARAIGGPQYGARIFQALLNQPDRLDKALSDTSPEKAKGSAQDELNHKLAQVDEQMKHVVNSIQRLGAALGEAGAFTGLGALLHIVNFMLDGFSKIVDLVNALPSEIRPFISGLAEAAAIVAVIRATRFGEAFAGRPIAGKLLAPTEATRVQRFQSEVGQQVEAGTLNRYGSNINSAQASRAAAYDASLAAQEQGQKAASLGADVEKNVAGATEARSAAMAQTTALTAKSVGLNVQAAEEEAAANRAMTVYQEQLALRNALLRGEVTAQEYAAVTGIPAALPASRRNARELAKSGSQAANAAAAEEAAVLGTRARTAEEQVAQSEAAAATQQAEGGKLQNLGSKFKANVLRGTSAMGLAISGFLAFTLGQAFFDSANQAVDAQNKAIDEVAKMPGNIDALNQKVKATKHPKDTSNLSSGVLDSLLSIPKILNPLDPLGLNPGESVKASLDRAAKANPYQTAQATRNATYATANQKGLYANEITAQAERNAAQAEAGTISRSEARRRQGVQLHEAENTMEKLLGNFTDLQQKQLQHEIRDIYLRGGGNRAKDPFAEFNASSTTEALATVQELGQRTSSTGKAPDYQRLAAGFTIAAARLPTTHGKDLKNLKAQIDDFDSQVNQSVGDKLKDALAFGVNNPESRQAAYTAAINEIGTAQGALKKDLGLYANHLTRARKNLAGLERQRDALGAGTQSVSADHPGPLGETSTTGRLQVLDATIAAEKAHIADIKKRLGDVRGAIAKENAKLQELRNQELQAQFSDFQKHAEALLGVQQGGTQDKIAIATNALNTYAQIANKARELFGPKSDEFLTAYARQLQAGKDLADAGRARIQAFGQLRTSQISGTGSEADISRSKSDLRTLQDVLAHDRASGADPGQIAQDLAAINDARRNITTAVEKYAQDTYDSLQALKIAQTDDPVKKAKIQLTTDIHDLDGLKGPDRTKQLAKIAGDKRAVTDAIFQADLQDATFQHDIAQITDTQYIDKLKQILKLKNLTKAERQQLEKQIYDLQHKDDSSLALNLGNIKLPTTYEIRRWGQSILGASSYGNPTANLTSNTTNHVNVNVNVARAADVPAVSKALDDGLNHSVSGALRARGLFA